jgi:hypothetical protein
MPTGPARTQPELSDYDKNRLLISDDQWRRYEKMWVALSADGSTILAGGRDFVELDQRLKALGVDIGHVGLEYVDLGEEALAGPVDTL